MTSFVSLYIASGAISALAAYLLWKSGFTPHGRQIIALQKHKTAIQEALKEFYNYRYMTGMFADMEFKKLGGWCVIVIWLDPHHDIAIHQNQYSRIDDFCPALLFVANANESEAMESYIDFLDLINNEATFSIDYYGTDFRAISYYGSGCIGKTPIELKNLDWIVSDYK